MNSSYLVHHGILGQEWGVQNGPPYPLGGAAYSKKELQAVYNKRKASKHNIYNKKHFDKVIKEGTTLNTLSKDPDRTKNTDMFYAAYKNTDKYTYIGNFSTHYAPDGSWSQKWKIKNKALSDMNVASEDSGSKVFKKLYETNRDFYNFVTDKNRLESLLPESKKYFKGYRESLKALEEIRESGSATEEQLDTVYRLFNYSLPNDGHGNARIGKDVANQRAKFFNMLKDAGYGAVLDVNDAIYGGYHADAPIIVFDQSKIIPDSISKVSVNERDIAPFIEYGSRLCSIWNRD